MSELVETKQNTELAPLPQGTSWLSPFLTVKSIDSIMGLYENVLGFHVDWTHLTKDEVMDYAQLSYNNCTIKLCLEGASLAGISPAGIEGSPSSFYLYTENIDTIIKNVKAAEWTICDGLTEQFWGDKTFSCIDPEGYKWTFATPYKSYNWGTCGGNESNCS